MDWEGVFSEIKQMTIKPASTAAPWSELLNSYGVRWGQTELDPTDRKLVVVLGNAYGLMKYQEPLARSLSSAGLNALWSSAPGQEGARGLFGLESGVTFLRELVQAAQEEEWELALLCHCASSLGAVELLNRYAPQNVRCLISYGPLLKLPALRERALGQLATSGVHSAIGEETWSLDFSAMLASLRCPTLIAHSLDVTNARRATAEQIKGLERFDCVRKTVLLDEGYDEKIENIRPFLAHYLDFLHRHW
jgi:hypothetical protein